jgi:hypothetical protein
MRADVAPNRGAILGRCASGESCCPLDSSSSTTVTHLPRPDDADIGRSDRLPVRHQQLRGLVDPFRAPPSDTIAAGFDLLESTPIAPRSSRDRVREQCRCRQAAARSSVTTRIAVGIEVALFDRCAGTPCRGFTGDSVASAELREHVWARRRIRARQRDTRSMLCRPEDVQAKCAIVGFAESTTHASLS